LLHIGVDVTTSKHAFAIDFLICAWLLGFLALEVFARGEERIDLICVRFVEFNAKVLEVLSCECVAICETNGLAIDVHVAANPEVLHLQILTILPWEAVPPDEGALRNATVILTGLGDLARVILQIIVDRDLAHPVVLEVRLNYRLFEVAVEAQDVAIESIPSRHLHVFLLVQRGMLKDGTCMAIGERARIPLVFGSYSLHKLRAVFGKALLGLNALAIENAPRLTFVVPFLIGRQVEAREVREISQDLRIDIDSINSH